MGGTLLDSLATLTRTHPTERKRLIGPDLHFGRELLLALAQRMGGWIGWEAENLRGIAGDLAFVPLADLGLRLVHDVEASALVNRALAECVEHGRVGEQFCDLALSLGFRRVLRDAILELRSVGVSVGSLRAVARPGSPAHDLAPVLESYEALLKQERLADSPLLFALALEYFDREAEFVLDGVLAVVPTLPVRGLPGQLLQRLLARGTHVLASDPPMGFDRPAHLVTLKDEGEKGAALPSLLALACAATLSQDASTAFNGSLVTVDVFAAATPANEIREICRRVVAEGLRWDDVEIVATDPDTYGIALDALAQRLDVGVTMLRGLPVARTRVGRALFRWFAWLGDGLPADILRQALEAGELHVAGHSVAPTALARELRALNVGWGRARYVEALARLAGGERLDDVTQQEDETDEEFAERRAARERASSATGALLAALMAVVPEVPERGSDVLVYSSCAALARATLGFLDLVPVHGSGEAQTIARIRGRLEFLAQVHDEQVAFGGALAALQESVAAMRAWPLHTNERKPWSATGGMVHLTDVAHGGTTGRSRVFVVGLDAGRSIGAGRQDPLLHDGLREQLSMQLATVAERRAESTYRLASMLASLRGRVTLSYAVSSMLDDREEGPAPLLLQVWRLVNGNPSATYESFRAALRPPASPVPSLRTNSGDSAPCLDARDVWLQAMSEGALLLDATSQLHAAFPDLAHGESVLALAKGEAATPFHGLVPEAGPQLDPTLHAETPISSSALELMAKCPLSWFYRYGLRLKLPVESEYDVTRWLDSAQRGTLLHEVYEQFASEFASRQNELASGEAEAHIHSIVTERIAEWRLKVPPPGDSAFDREKEELESAARAFLQLESDRRSQGDEGRWRSFENEFGFERPPAYYALSDGKSLALRGRVDRVDELPDGSLRVVDYKTGAPSHYGRNPKAGPFNGGRNLQPALYAAAVAEGAGQRVSTFEYLFPTERGSNEIIAYSADELDAARPIVEALVESVREGRFLPTMDEGDCRFCDCTPICRGVEDRFGRRTVPRVTWAKERGIELSEYKTMCALRSRKVEASDE